MVSAGLVAARSSPSDSRWTNPSLFIAVIGRGFLTRLR
jgi:hypothetical protein